MYNVHPTKFHSISILYNVNHKATLHDILRLVNNNNFKHFGPNNSGENELFQPWLETPTPERERETGAEEEKVVATM